MFATVRPLKWKACGGLRCFRVPLSKEYTIEALIITDSFPLGSLLKLYYKGAQNPV